VIAHATRRSVALDRSPQNARALRAPVAAVIPSRARRPGFLSRAYAFAERHPIEVAMIAPAPIVVVIMVALHQADAFFWWLEHVVLPLAGR
jgi:hypothetical protein